MRNIKARAEIAMGIAITQGIEFSAALKVADKLMAAQDEFIEAHMPAIGKTVVCKDNMPSDPGFDACQQLKVDSTYKVTGEDENGRIFVEDLATGQKIGDPFYKIRFEAVVD